MKLLGLFSVAAVWLQLPVEGECGRIPSSHFSQLINGGVQMSSEEVPEEYNDTSNTIKFFLKISFSMPEWRHLMILSASPEDLADPVFRVKWRITDKDVRKKEDEAKVLTSVEKRKRRKFFHSRNWKGMKALSSTKAELTNPQYRSIWGLGTLTKQVKNSDENGNFFEGPQWKEFLKATGLKLEEGADDQAKAKALTDWGDVIGSEIDSIFLRRTEWRV